MGDELRRDLVEHFMQGDVVEHLTSSDYSLAFFAERVAPTPPKET